MNEIIKINKPGAIHEMSALREGKNHVIAASAGTGKTYTLERLVLDKILAGVPIDRILVLTFTRRAAAEMKARIRKTLTEVLDKSPEDHDEGDHLWSVGDQERHLVEEALNGFDEATISTIHSFCQSVISDHAFSSGQLFNASRIDAAEVFEECFYDLLRDTLAAEEPYKSWLKQALKEGVKLDQLIKDIKNIVSRDATVLPDVGDDPFAYFGENSPEKIEEKWKLETVLWHLITPKMKERIREALIAGEQMTYDDLIAVVQSGVVSGGQLKSVLKKRYEVALIDEFQDTSPAQWDIFREVFLKDEERELYVIGDEKQSIYGFRGADLGTYREAIEDDGFAGEEPVNLGRNFRSTNALIEAYNQIFEGPYFDGAYIPVKPPPESKQVQRPIFEDDQRFEALGREPIAVAHLDTEGEKEGKGKVFPVYQHWVADKIGKLLEGTREERFIGVDGDGKPEYLVPGDIYVLTRTNREAEEMGDLLADRGVPFGFYRKPGLFDSDEAQHVVRLLKAIAHPSDRSLRRKAMLTPFFGLRLDELLDYDEVEEGAWSARKQLQSWGDMAGRRDYTRLFDEIMSGSGVIRRALLTTDSERRLTNYHHLFDWLLKESSRGNLGIEQMADLLQRRREGNISGDEDEGADLQRLESDGSSVQIMTMHKAKGLSAEVVFVCGGFGKRDDLNKGKFRKLKKFSSKQPENWQGSLAFHIDGEEELPEGVFDDYSGYIEAEAKRLFYVAITRAKSKVYLPYIEEGSCHSWCKKSEIRLLFRALEGLDGEGLENIEDIEGFEKERVKLSDYDISPTPPTLIESFEDLEIADRERWEALKVGAQSEREVDFESLKNQRIRVTTSYSGMKGASSDLGSAIRLEHENPLPKSKNAGNALHEILEFMDYSTALRASSWEEWIQLDNGDESIEELIGEHLEAQGFDAGLFLPYTAQILYQTLRAPLQIDDGQLHSVAALEGGESQGHKTAREVSFLVPIPQAPSSTLGAVAPPDIQVEKGYFTGEIDLVFEQDGRVYIGDWKSDTRVGGTSFDRAILSAHVEAHYRKQVAVYTTALMRMLGIEDEQAYEERFGGFFYLFVRGMNEGGDEGQFFERLDWEDAQQLHREFVANASPARAIENWAEQRQGKG